MSDDDRTEADNPDQEEFPIERRGTICPECLFAGGDHHPLCPNS